MHYLNLNPPKIHKPISIKKCRKLIQNFNTHLFHSIKKICHRFSVIIIMGNEIIHFFPISKIVLENRSGYYIVIYV